MRVSIYQVLEQSPGNGDRITGPVYFREQLSATVEGGKREVAKARRRSKKSIQVLAI